MKLAANTVATTLNDTLTAITPGGSNTWTANFTNPGTGQPVAVYNLSIPANTILVYVGGTSFPGASEAGLGSIGGYNATGDSNFLLDVSGRGKPGTQTNPPTASARWGGDIAFDNSGATNWFFGTTTAGLTSAQTDFLSVAEHEMGHVLGLGTSEAWFAKVDTATDTFTGANSEAVFGGPVPLDPAGAHWAQGVQSDGATALMDPVLVNGTRVTYTSLDFAALSKISTGKSRPRPPRSSSAPRFTTRSRRLVR